MKRAYAVVTVPRTERYVDQTLESLKRTGFFENNDDLPLHLISASPDDSHLSAYVGDARFEIHRLTKDEEAHWARIGTIQRCAFGHYVAMKRMLELERSWDELLIFEDDIKFASGWLPYLDGKIMPDVRTEAGGASWILELYYFVSDGIKEDFAAGRRIRNRSWKNFFGTQGNLYPRSVVTGLCPFLLDVCVEKAAMPVDNGVCRYAEVNKLPLFATVPSLIDHIGRQSTGQTPYFHWARCFYDPVRDPKENT